MRSAARVWRQPPRNNRTRAVSDGGRLIGVITHRPGVAERLGAAIRVARGPDGVSRVVADEP